MTFYGFMGITAALAFSNMGAAYGTAKSGVGICSIGVARPDLVFKSLIPVVMAGILGIYGLIVAVILVSKVEKTQQADFGTPSKYAYNDFTAWKHLASGLCCGLSSLAAGLAIGVVGDFGIRANAQKDMFVGVILILIFAEALGLYGLIIAIILTPVE